MLPPLCNGSASHVLVCVFVRACMCVWACLSSSLYLVSLAGPHAKNCEITLLFNTRRDGSLYFPQLGECSLCFPLVCGHCTHTLSLSLSLSQLPTPAVFVFNHASPHDFQPLSLRQHHSQLVDLFTGTRTSIEGSNCYVLHMNNIS